MTDHLNSDLSAESAFAFFTERDPGLAKAIQGMESCESWTRDRVESVQSALQSLADRVDEFDFDNLPNDLHNRIIILFGYISSGKAIKLLMWIDQCSPNFVARTLAEAQMLAVIDKPNQEASRLFIERFEVLERLNMLSRVFAEDRLILVERVLRILSGDEAAGEEDEESFEVETFDGN